jgi:diguanylate cyclase (GGDEF)-like protein
MPNYAPINGPMRRILFSWLPLVLALTVLAGLGASAIGLLDARSHEQAAAAAVEDARVITRLTALRDLGRENATEPFTTRERMDLNGDVAQLSTARDLLDLSIRRLNGTVLYRRGVLATEPGVASGPPTAQAPTVRFFNAAGSASVATPAITVEFLTAIGPAVPPLIVAVTIPARSVEDQSRWASTVLTVTTVIVVVLAAMGLVLLRRRLRRRGYQASHDSLTGLGNRLLLESASDELFARHAPFVLMMMDLDGFKRINDSLGHAAGDELLVLVAQALRGSVRPQDLLVRLGGDEFAVLMPGLDGDHVEAAANRLLVGVRTQFTTRGVAVDCDASVGAAVARQDGDDFGQLMQAADIAMYQAKRGKLGVRVFADTDADVNAGDLQTLIDLRIAIDNEQLRLHYQPTAALRRLQSQDGDGYLEALVRWQHPIRGLLSPDQFIPLAEDTALIHPLTEWVLNEAVRQCGQWRLDGLEATIAVNVSPRSLTYPGLLETVIDTLARHQLPAEALHLEITESAILARPDLARQTLTQLRDRGICISIDDFGTGYTSLAHLKTLPIETLKIDRCFISDLLTEPSDQTVVAAIIGLGHGLGMKIVAEGVEDKATLQRLTELGCDIAQGFYLSRPLPANDATQWLRAQHTKLTLA